MFKNSISFINQIHVSNVRSIYVGKYINMLFESGLEVSQKVSSDLMLMTTGPSCYGDLEISIDKGTVSSIKLQKTSLSTEIADSVRSLTIISTPKISSAMGFSICCALQKDGLNIESHTLGKVSSMSNSTEVIGNYEFMIIGNVFSEPSRLFSATIFESDVSHEPEASAQNTKFESTGVFAKPQENSIQRMELHMQCGPGHEVLQLLELLKRTGMSISVGAGIKAAALANRYIDSKGNYTFIAEGNVITEVRFSVSEDPETVKKTDDSKLNNVLKEKTNE